MLAVAMIIYAERKIWAAIALRRGPNVVGPGACCKASPTASRSS
jgi:NADH:ubiquinone oxidoreductase subunit H